ncbi:hypothetical protein A1OE_163 [Candidatus Endolissoclinum faulkneri L2]|uniref:Uncharacterized protein n=1 Tax=Candidatus Endolissoclinum faulkneri L2 TaxID=1193729 RepID=K7ZC77_9PROT|nr:hypothetical protein A1OE_163 [Candidatus Endolissoclinum faulkneri L2]
MHTNLANHKFLFFLDQYQVIKGICYFCPMINFNVLLFIC